MSEDTEHNVELADMPSFDDEPAVAETPPVVPTKAAPAKAEKGQTVGAKSKAPVTGTRVAGQVVKRGEKPPERAPLAGGVELVRITKTGHGQVHDGEGGTYDWGAEVLLNADNALALEKISYGEII